MALGRWQTGRTATRWWPWLPLPAALAAGITLVLWHQPVPPALPVSQNPPPAAATPAPEFVISLASVANPLQAEAREFHATPNGRVFLVDCLPSFASAGE